MRQSVGDDEKSLPAHVHSGHSGLIFTGAREPHGGR